MPALLEFQCHRPVGGYRFVEFDQRKLSGLRMGADGKVIPPPDASEDERLVLSQWDFVILMPYPKDSGKVLHILLPTSRKKVTFDLFADNPGLFLEFAHTPISQAGVLSFVNRFGCLLNDAVPETIAHWSWRIRELRRAVREWESAQASGDYTKLVRLIERQVKYRDAMWRGEATGLEANVLLKNDGLVPSLCIRPSELCGALWIQFALAIDGSQNFRSCSVCQTWFPVAAGRSRTDKEYCSDACRMRAYRKRKASKTEKTKRLG